MSPDTLLRRRITRADTLLPGIPVPDDQDDPRWTAICRIGDFIHTHPEPIWEFIVRWGRHPQLDLRVAIACCLLEHLLQYHFAAYFPRVREQALESVRFATMFEYCWLFGQAEEPRNAARMKWLARQIRARERRRGEAKSRQSRRGCT